jgi:hypothetical protein
MGFGGALVPSAEVLNYPSMLDFPAPRLRAYAREAVIAEKFQAMVMLGRANSRMKDFYDIWILSRSHNFSDDRLARGIAATFERRETPIPTDLPDGLTNAFAKDEQKQRQWRAFVEGVAHDPGDLTKIIPEIAAFLMPHALAAAALGKCQVWSNNSNGLGSRARGSSVLIPQTARFAIPTDRLSSELKN